MADLNLGKDLSKDLGKDFGKDTGFGSDLGKKKGKHSLFGLLLILIGVYFLIQEKIEVLSEGKIYNGVAIGLVLIGIIVFLRRK